MLVVCWPPKDGRGESQQQRRNSLPKLSPEDNISSCRVFAVDNFFVCLWSLLIGYILLLTMASCLIWLKEGYWGFILYFANLACCTSWRNRRPMQTKKHIYGDGDISQMDQWTTCSGEKYRNQSQKPQMTQVAMRLRATIKAIQSRWNSLPGPKAGYTWTMMVACGGRFSDRVWWVATCQNWWTVDADVRYTGSQDNQKIIHPHKFFENNVIFLHWLPK